MEPTMHPVQPQPSWWSRNWKWATPVGCLVLLLPPLLLTGFVGGILAIVFGTMKSFDIYQQAFNLARSNPAVIEALGEPVEDGLFMGGQISVNGPSGSANISIPLHGPKGKGTLYVVASKSAGRWEYQTLEVAVEGRDDRIDLLEAERDGS